MFLLHLPEWHPAFSFICVPALYTSFFWRRFLSVCLLFKWMKCIPFTQPVMMVLRDHNSNGRILEKIYQNIFCAPRSFQNHFWFLCDGTLCCWKKPQPLWKVVKFPACATGLPAVMFPTCLLLVPSTSRMKVDSCFPSVTNILNCECCSISPQLLSSIWLKFCFSKLNVVALPNFANLLLNEKTQRFYSNPDSESLLSKLTRTDNEADNDKGVDYQHQCLG